MPSRSTIPPSWFSWVGFRFVRAIVRRRLVSVILRDDDRGVDGEQKKNDNKAHGLLDTPTAGSYTLDGEEVAGFSRRKLAHLRNQKIGFIFQAPYLIPFLNVTDNVALLPMLAGKANGDARKRALELLTI